MTPLHQDPLKLPETDTSSLSEPLLLKEDKVIEAKIMITPCKHKYHPVCLKQWMEVKLECPTCRTEIPGID